MAAIGQRPKSGYSLMVDESLYIEKVIFCGRFS
jgi:hypothetical protein